MQNKDALTQVAIIIGVLIGCAMCTIGVFKEMNVYLIVFSTAGIVLLWIFLAMAVINRITLASDKSLSLLLYKAAKLKTREGDASDVEKAIVRKCEGHPEAWLGYKMLGELFTVRGDSNKAWEYFNRCEQAMPADASEADRALIWNDLGGAALATKRHDQAMEYFLKASEKDPAYLRGTGLMYAFGWGVDIDTTVALNYLKKATERGCDLAVPNLYEVMWRTSHEVSPTTINGFMKYMNCCHCGKGVTAGVQPLKESALQGYAPAQFEIGTLYQSGSMRVDAQTLKREAFRWYNAAARQGYLPALHNLGFLAQQMMVDPETGTIFEPKVKSTLLYDIEDIKRCSLGGHKLILRAAEAGYAPSQHSIGVRYLVGGETLVDGLKYTFFEVDRTEAWHWLTEAADQGLAAAKVDLKKYFGEEY